MSAAETTFNSKRESKNRYGHGRSSRTYGYGPGMHLLHHVVPGIKHFGPVYGTWMFSFERFNSWMCRRTLNRASPEATVMQTYRVCHLFFKFVDSIVIVLLTVGI